MRLSEVYPNASFGGVYDDDLYYNGGVYDDDLYYTGGDEGGYDGGAVINKRNMGIIKKLWALKTPAEKSRTTWHKFVGKHLKKTVNPGKNISKTKYFPVKKTVKRKSTSKRATPKRAVSKRAAPKRRRVGYYPSIKYNPDYACGALNILDTGIYPKRAAREALSGSGRRRRGRGGDDGGDDGGSYYSDFVHNYQDFYNQCKDTDKNYRQIQKMNRTHNAYERLLRHPELIQYNLINQKYLPLEWGKKKCK